MPKLIVKSLALLLVSAAGISYAGGRKPAWVKKRPADAAYYFGIGKVDKSSRGRDFAKSAKSAALNDLASEISVTISGELVATVAERSGLSETDVRSEIRSSTKADLEGFELVGTWEDKRAYWACYRLSKAEYRLLRARKIAKAVKLALDLFVKARAKERAGDASAALMFYVKAMDAVRDFIGEPLETEHEGRRILLANEIHSSLQSLLSRIRLKAAVRRTEARMGRPLKAPLRLSAVLSSDGGADKPARGLPLKCSFLRGKGEIVPSARTDPRGKAGCRVVKVGREKIQLVEVRLDLLGWMERGASSTLLKEMVKKLAVPKAKFVLRIAGRPVFLSAKETNLGKRVSPSYLEPPLREALSEKGFEFVDDESKAEVLIELKAKTRRGSEWSGMYTAFADVSVSVLDMETGEELYKGGVTNVKGIQLDHSAAGLDALKKAAGKVESELLPRLLKGVQ